MENVNCTLYRTELLATTEILALWMTSAPTESAFPEDPRFAHQMTNAALTPAILLLDFAIPSSLPTLLVAMTETTAHPTTLATTELAWVSSLPILPGYPPVDSGQPLLLTTLDKILLSSSLLLEVLLCLEPSLEPL
jgi:hypothetical protein